MNTRFKKLSLALIPWLLLTFLPLSISEAQEKRPLFFYVFLHDDIPASERGSIRADYFVWLIKDLESFTGRRVYLEIIQDAPFLKNINYKTQDLHAGLKEWTSHIDRYTKEKNLPKNGTTKYLLLTRHKVNSDTLGYTRVGHYAAIASMATYTAPAHEIGHMLGGDHEYSEILFRNGWWCETNITATRQSVRANCYVYSDKNKELMNRHLNRFP